MILQRRYCKSNFVTVICNLRYVTTEHCIGIGIIIKWKILTCIIYIINIGTATLGNIDDCDLLKHIMYRYLLFSKYFMISIFINY